MAERLSPNWSKRRETVQFLCVHWTGGGFAGSVDWCLRPESEVSYHDIIGPDGTIRHLVDYDHAAWAVGVSRSPLAGLRFTSGNHASESVALAGCPPVPVTPEQRRALVGYLVARMQARGWGPDEVGRILGHDQVASFPAGHARAGQFGRKPDPQGSGWLPLLPIRSEVAHELRHAGRHEP